MPVGKHLNALAASHMKRATMELGGHAPVMVFDDADVDGAAKLMGAFKYRNAGQVCVSPTRFFVHDKVYDKFVGQFIDIAKAIKVGDGLEPTARWARSPIRAASTPSRRSSPTRRSKGAKVATGGKRIGNQGNFFQPTVLTDVPENARIMTRGAVRPGRRDAALQGDRRRAGPAPTSCPSAWPATPSPRTPRRRPRSPTRSTAAW